MNSSSTSCLLSNLLTSPSEALAAAPLAFLAPWIVEGRPVTEVNGAHRLSAHLHCRFPLHRDGESACQSHFAPKRHARFFSLGRCLAKLPTDVPLTDIGSVRDDLLRPAYLAVSVATAAESRLPFWVSVAEKRALTRVWSYRKTPLSLLD
jgi:hypothetical protein